MVLAGKENHIIDHRVNRGIHSILLCCTFLLLCLPPSQAEDIEQLDHIPRFYLQMKNEDFLRAMVPKEKFLLSLVQCVNQEIWRRKSEGLQESDLGMDQLVSPEERVVEALLMELDLVAGLLDEITDLERRAKQKVDFRVLEALSELKNRVFSLLKIEQPPDLYGGRSTATDQGETETESTESRVAPPDSLIDSESFEDVFEQRKYNRFIDYKVQMAEY